MTGADFDKALQMYDYVTEMNKRAGKDINQEAG